MPHMPRREKHPETMFSTTYLRNNSRNQRVNQSLIGAYDELLSKKIGSSLLIDRSWQILHVFGGAEKYLQYTSGRPSGYVLDAIHEKLKSALGAAIHHAARKNTEVIYRSIPLSIDGVTQNLRVAVEPISDPVTGTGNLLISFGTEAVEHASNAVQTADEAPSAAASETPSTLAASSTPHAKRVIAMNSDEEDIKAERVSYLETELVHAQENLQATIEEMETSNEELQAANEELVASNEELQSTNEELHSVNEELYTVNAEHQRRLAELAEANADMDNLLATTRVGVAFLDSDFRIRRYTPQIAQVLQIDSHSLGRPIVDFARRLQYDELIESLREVRSKQIELERKVYDESGIPFLLRIVPYRSGARCKELF